MKHPIEARPADGPPSWRKTFAQPANAVRPRFLRKLAEVDAVPPAPVERAA